MVIGRSIFLSHQFAKLCNIAQVDSGEEVESRGLKGGHNMVKMTRMFADQPHIYWRSIAQPCDRITGPVIASMACNSQHDLVKTMPEESDHHEITSQSKIDQGHD